MNRLANDPDTSEGTSEDFEERRRTLLARKEELGRKASYVQLSKRISCSHTTAFHVLKGQETAIPVNREGILEEIEEALDEIERGDESPDR